MVGLLNIKPLGSQALISGRLFVQITLGVVIVLGAGFAVRMTWAAQQRTPAAPAPAPAPAAASSATPVPAAGSILPERTTAVFGDWTVTCNPRQGQPSLCEAALTLQDQQRQIAMVFAIGRPVHDQPLHAVVRVLPVNTRVSAPVRLVIDAADPVVIPFQQCNQLGCFADLELRDESLLRRLRTRPADTAGRVEWHDAGNAEVAMPFSTRGFAAAMDALAAAK